MRGQFHAKRRGLFTRNIHLHARESIINSVFALEAAANCLLDRLDLQRKFLDDVDKLGTLNKFELFLVHEYSGLQIDRGETTVQKIEELINLRNRFVHPRYTKIDGEYVAEGVYKAGKLARKNATKIPNLTSHWTTDDAKNSIVAIGGFFGYFFIDLCCFEEDEVSGILCSKNHHPDGTSTWIISRELMEAFKTLRELNLLERSFMKVPDGDYDIHFMVDDGDE